MKTTSETGEPTGDCPGMVFRADAAGDDELIRQLQALNGSHGGVGRARALLDAGSLQLAEGRALELLQRPGWQERNRGVKIAGLLASELAVPRLVEILRNRRPASWLRRVLGGDFEEPGFVRRNAVAALARIGLVPDDVEEVLLAALSDPYYEVRTAAIDAVSRIGDRLLQRERALSMLTSLVSDSNMEVAAAAAIAAGRLGDISVLGALLGTAMHPSPRIRTAALMGILALVERGLIGDREALARAVSRFMLTSTDFTPQFDIKATYRRLMESLVDREATPR
jgi:UDP-N-acetylglucosamine--N-acetylmuramyl-(pentapeptide) pyrophosphoryl-undecaprenol N-acetylglucosamine transferase